MKAVVLGIGQDEGVPGFCGIEKLDSITGKEISCLATCLAIVEPENGRRWLIECTPDVREQLRLLIGHETKFSTVDRSTLLRKRPVFDGIFLTHAHIGHYAGLMFLGKESIDDHAVPVFCMPAMAKFLKENGPWSQLVSRGNISLNVLQPWVQKSITESLSVTPVPVPHRGEFSETVGFRFQGPQKSFFFLPDIDCWDQLDDQLANQEDPSRPKTLEQIVESVDFCFLDATFYSGDELGGRDMTEVPHPTVSSSIQRFTAKATPESRAKIHFIHLNATNPVLDSGSAQRKAALDAGLSVAEKNQIFDF